MDSRLDKIAHFFQWHRWAALNAADIAMKALGVDLVDLTFEIRMENPMLPADSRALVKEYLRGNAAKGDLIAHYVKLSLKADAAYDGWAVENISPEAVGLKAFGWVLKSLSIYNEAMAAYADTALPLHLNTSETKYVGDVKTEYICAAAKSLSDTASKFPRGTPIFKDVALTANAMRALALARGIDCDRIDAGADLEGAHLNKLKYELGLALASPELADDLKFRTRLINAFEEAYRRFLRSLAGGGLTTEGGKLLDAVNFWFTEAFPRLGIGFTELEDIIKRVEAEEKLPMDYKRIDNETASVLKVTGFMKFVNQNVSRIFFVDDASGVLNPNLYREDKKKWIVGRAFSLTRCVVIETHDESKKLPSWVVASNLVHEVKHIQNFPARFKMTLRVLDDEKSAYEASIQMLSRYRSYLLQKGMSPGNQMIREITEFIQKSKIFVEAANHNEDKGAKRIHPQYLVGWFLFKRLEDYKRDDGIEEATRWKTSECMEQIFTGLKYCVNVDPVGMLVDWYIKRMIKKDLKQIKRRPTK